MRSKTLCNIDLYRLVFSHTETGNKETQHVFNLTQFYYHFIDCNNTSIFGYITTLTLSPSDKTAHAEQLIASDWVDFCKRVKLVMVFKVFVCVEMYLLWLTQSQFSIAKPACFPCVCGSLDTTRLGTPQKSLRIHWIAGWVAGLSLQGTFHLVGVVVVIGMQKTINHLTNCRMFTIKRICVHFVLYSTNTDLLML